MPKGIPRATPCERGHPWVRENRTPGNHCLTCSLLYPGKRGRPKGPTEGICKRGHPRIGRCKICAKLRKAAYRAARPDQFRESKKAQTRRQRERDPEKYYARKREQARRKRRRRWQRQHPELRWSERPEQKLGREEHIREYLLTHPCVDCGATDPVILEFDHRVPTHKDCSVHQCGNFAQREREIAKCDVRCCNCHTRRHYYENLAARMTKKFLTPNPQDAILIPRQS